MSDIDNKRVVKNSIFLYLRMLFTMWINLYSTRLLLKNLGQEDYGIYGVVGSIVSLFSILNSGIIQSIQRFITIEIGKQYSRLNTVFNTIRVVTYIFALLSLFLLEILGYWYINNKLNIPRESLNNAIICFHLSVATSVLSLLSNPYNALIVAYEKINVFAWVSMLQVCLNCLSAYLLVYLQDKALVLYSSLIFTTSIIVQIIYIWYCLSNFKDSHFSNNIDLGLIKKIFKFTGWSSLDGIFSTIIWQGSTLLINFFYGVTINTVYSISTQINRSIQGFAQNIQKAVDPQITKSYASGNIIRHNNLVYAGSKIETLFILFIIIPFEIRTEYILRIWLGEVPDYLTFFAKMSVFMGLIACVLRPVFTSLIATGKLKKFVIYSNLMHILMLPTCYILNSNYKSPYIIMIIILLFYIIVSAYRLFLASQVSSFSFKIFIFDVVIKSSIFGFSVYFIVLYISHFIGKDLFGLIIILIINCILLLPIFYFFVFNSFERKKILNTILSIISKHK